MRISDWSSDVCSSDLGLSPFEGENYDNIRYVATGYSSPFQIVVDADSPVQSVADLAGKRVGVLVGITAQEWFPRVAEVYGVKGKFEEFQLRDRKSTRLNSSH